MFDRMKEDIITIFENDPAANSLLEVVFTYTGLHALWAHRFAHWFYRKRWHILAPAQRLNILKTRYFSILNKSELGR